MLDSEVGIYTNVVSHPITVAITGATLVWQFGDVTGFLVDMFLKVRSSNGMEIVLITNVDGGLNQITVLRAQDGTTAVAHTVGTEALAAIPAIAFNQMREEIQAVEGELIGPGFLHDVIISSADATGGDQLKDSFGLVLRSHRWAGGVGPSTVDDVKFLNDVFGTGTDAYQLAVEMNSVVKMVLRTTSTLLIDNIQALVTNGPFTVGFNGTGGIAIGGVTAAAGRARIGSPDGTDYIDVLDGNLGFVTASGFKVFIDDTTIQVRNAIPIVFYSDNGTTEQSRITPVVGSTTWLASLASDIIIKTTTGGITIGGAAALDGQIRLSSPDGTDRVEVVNSALDLYEGNVRRFRLNTAFNVSNATPLVWYAGGLTDERFRLSSAASTGFELTADETGVFFFTNESTVPVFGVGIIQPDMANNNLRFRLNPPTAGSSSFTFGPVTPVPVTLAVGTSILYMQFPLENPPETQIKIVGSVSGLMFRAEDGLGFGPANGNAVVFWSDAIGAVEESRISSTTGSTTWAAIAGSDILITHTATGGIVLGAASAANNEIRIAGPGGASGLFVDLNTPMVYANAAGGRGLEIRSATDVRINTLSAITTNGDFTINFQGVGGIVLGNATPAAGQIKMQAVNGIGFICTTTTAVMSTASGNVLSITGTTTSILLGETKLRGPIVLYSDVGTTEEGRFTIAANSIIFAATGGAAISINNDQGQTAVMIDAGANAVTRIRSDGTGLVAIGNSADTDILIIASANTTLTRNSVDLLTITDTEFAHTNLATAPVVFHNTTSSERWRFNPTQLIGQLDDPADNAAANSPTIILRAKNNPTGAPPVSDFDFTIQHVVSAGSGGTVPTLDTVFEIGGVTGFTIRRKVASPGDYTMPLVPEVNTVTATAADYPGAIVKDLVNGIGSNCFFSDGTNWTEL